MWMITEIWKDIEGYEGLYQISNLGSIKSLNYKRTKQEKILKPRLTVAKYYQVDLCKNGSVKKMYIHRLVAKTFIENPNNFALINHKDENPMNNKVENLEWCNSKYNNNYGKCKEKNSKKHSKKINQYDLQGNLIKTWNGLKEAEETLKISRGNICLCCQGVRKNAGGYIWRYANE